MLRRILRLFRKYTHHHGRIAIPGFMLRGSGGARIGNLDRIYLHDRSIHVEGWADADRIGLIGTGQEVQGVPNMPRLDAVADLGNPHLKTPGFFLEMPYDPDYQAFWTEVGGTRYVQQFRPVRARALWLMRIRLLFPFIRDGLRALPAAVHWAKHRDVYSAERVKDALRLRATRHWFEDAAPLKRLAPQALAPADAPGPAPLNPVPTISIVIPVYNAFDLLPEVLQRVTANTDIPYRLIVVEDASPDGRVRPWLHDWHASLPSDVRAHISILENAENLGFIRSVNRAFEQAIPLGDHVVLLNSDAFVPAGWASRLIRPLLEGQNVASVTPMSNDAEIFNVPAICKRADLAPGQADEIDRITARLAAGNDLAEAPTGVGFCMAMHIDYLRQLPSFDTSFGRGYGEEVDWCQRARHLGGRHLGLASLFVEHRGGTSFGSEEKQKLIAHNNQMVASRYPRYDDDVQTFIQRDPLITQRLVLGMAWAATRRAGPVPVYLAHSMGGGAESYLQNRVQTDLAEGHAAIILRVGGQMRWQIELHSNLGTAGGITRGGTDDTDFVHRLLGLLPARKVIYSCGVGDRDPVELPGLLTALARGARDKVEVLFHDYFPLSPSYTLLDSHGVFGGVPRPGQTTDVAHQMTRSRGHKISLADWRAAWDALLHRANTITVFSQNSRDLVVQACPDVADTIQVMPHALLIDIPPVLQNPSTSGVPVIGVLGNIGYQKGAAILRDMSQALAQTGQAQLVVIGDVDPAYPLAPPARIHGAYQLNDIPALIRRYGITSWLMPSIWPETFSYTTHEMLATGLPVWSFDIGAQGAAVRAAVQAGYPGGLIPLIEATAASNWIAGLEGSKGDTEETAG